MANTSFHGKDGSATFGTKVISNLISSALDIVGDVAEATAMNDTSGFKTYKGGHKDWTATLECNLSSDGKIDEAGTYSIVAAVLTEDTLVVTPKSGLSFTGNAILVGIGPSSDKDDNAKVTLTFQGSGPLS